MRPGRLAVLLGAFFGLLACRGGGPSPTAAPISKTQAAPERVAPRAVADRGRAITAIDLEVDVSKRSGVGRYELAEADEDGGLTLEVGNLEIIKVSDERGPLKHSVRGDELDIGIPAGITSVSVEYRYGVELQFNGALPSGSTFTWPMYCGNLFPCRSAPREGSTYTILLTGVPKGKLAVYPRKLETASPAYMVAWAIGDYTYRKLGETKGGLEVGYYATSTLQQDVALGTRTLLDAVQWAETTLGPYAFGDRIGAVATAWGESRFESMEHHPYWHVSTPAASTPRDNVHQAIHGWFGNAVRIACWEDFLLSEGTTSYLTARAVEATEGEAMAKRVWADYETRLDQQIAWPKGCGKFDVLKQGLTTTAPYYKGALFFRALETRIGREKLDAALSSFYRSSIGSARRFSELLAHIEEATGYDPSTCADEWLREPHPPAEKSCP